MKPSAIIDFETYYDKECSVKPLGPVAYTHHPKFKAYLVSIVTSDGDEFCGPPEDFEWECLEGYILVAHNASFDKAVFDYLIRLGVIPVTFLKAIWHCTASIAAYLGAPRSLAGAVKALYDHDLNKGIRNWMMGKTWQDAINAGKSQELTTYCLDDSRWAARIYTDHAPTIPEKELRLIEHTIRSGNNGMRLDMEYVNNAGWHLQTEALPAIEAQIPWVATGSVPASPKALAEYCRSQGVEPPKSTAQKSEILEDWIEEQPEDSSPLAAVRAVGQWRRCNRVLKLLDSLVQRQVDGTFYFSTKYFGAHTGRWSGDAGFNVHNLPRKPFEIAGQSVDLRGCIIPRKGYKFVVTDLSQIEARIALWLAGDEPQLEAIRSGYNVYEAHARATMGWTGGLLSEENPNIYALAKARILGLGYGCGYVKFVEAAKILAGLIISLEESRRTVYAFRKSNPLIVAQWAKFDAELKKVCADPNENIYEVELPSGRTQKYFNPIHRAGQSMVQTVMHGKHISTYGSLVFQNWDQGIARDILGEAVLRIEEQTSHSVILTVHDEVITEVPIDYDGNIIKKLMEEPPEWAEGLPIGSKMECVMRYKK